LANRSELPRQLSAIWISDLKLNVMYPLNFFVIISPLAAVQRRADAAPGRHPRSYFAWVGNNPEEPPLHGLPCPPYHLIAKPAAKLK
jgi:hypothetical protein